MLVRAMPAGDAADSSGPAVAPGARHRPPLPLARLDINPFSKAIVQK
jgi:hypothetical protein